MSSLLALQKVWKNNNKGHFKTLKKIFPIFNKINDRDSHGLTQLYRAARHGNRALVAKLLKKGADPNVSSACGFYPLPIAAFWGEVKIVEMLLEAGADPSVTNESGWTPLHSASLCAGLEGRRAVIDLLIEKGADKHAADAYGWAPEDYAHLWTDPNNPRLNAIFEQLKKMPETKGHQPDMNELGIDKKGNKPPPPRKPKDGQVPRHH